MTHDTFESLLSVSSRVGPMFKALLIVAEGTGRRISAIAELRWPDVHFGSNVIRWRAENDKSGYEDTRPAAPHVMKALSDLQLRSERIGDTPVFPSPKDPQSPVSRHLLDDWLRRAYEFAEIEPEPGGLWHPIRRKWVTERANYPTTEPVNDNGTLMGIN